MRRIAVSGTIHVAGGGAAMPDGAQQMQSGQSQRAAGSMGSPCAFSKMGSGPFVPQMTCNVPASPDIGAIAIDRIDSSMTRQSVADLRTIPGLYPPRPGTDLILVNLIAGIGLTPRGALSRIGVRGSPG